MGHKTQLKFVNADKSKNVLDDIAEDPPHYHELLWKGKLMDSALGAGRNFIPKDREISFSETAGEKEETLECNSMSIFGLKSSS